MTIKLEEFELEKVSEVPDVQHAVCSKCFPKREFYGTTKTLRALCGTIVTGICTTSTKCVVCLDLFGKPCSVCGYKPRT